MNTSLEFCRELDALKSSLEFLIGRNTWNDVRCRNRSTGITLGIHNYFEKIAGTWGCLSKSWILAEVKSVAS